MVEVVFQVRRDDAIDDRSESLMYLRSELTHVCLSMPKDGATNSGPIEEPRLRKLVRDS